MDRILQANVLFGLIVLRLHGLKKTPMNWELAILNLGHFHLTSLKKDP